MEMSNRLSVKDKLLPFASDIIQNLDQHLITLQIDLSDYCVCKCKGCTHWQWESKTVIDFDMLKKNVLDNLDQFESLQSIVLSGGEPLMYKQVEELCEICHQKYGLKVGIITSGLGRKDVDWKRLSENCSWIRFSVDAFTPERFAYTRGVDMFDTWTKNLDTLLEHNKTTGCNSRLNLTIHEYNTDYFTEGVLDFIESRQIGIYYWLSRELIAAFRNNEMQDFNKEIIYQLHGHKDDHEFENGMYVGRKEGAKTSFIKEAIDRGLDHLINIGNVNDNLKEAIKYESCYAPRIYALINTDGAVFPCCYMYEPVFTPDKQQRQFVIGNVYEQSLLEIYDSNKYLEVAKQFNECQKKFPQCKFCDRYDHVNKYLNEFETDMSTDNKDIFL